MLSRLNSPPLTIAVYASWPPSPTDSRNTRYQAGATPYPGRTSTGWNTPASWRTNSHFGPSSCHIVMAGPPGQVPGGMLVPAIHRGTVLRGWPEQDAMGVGGRGTDYPVGCPKPIDRRDPMTKHVAPANTETAFNHDSTLVVALEL